MYPDGKLKTSRLYGIVVLSVNRTLIMQEKSIFMSFLEDLILQRRLMIGLRNIPILKSKNERIFLKCPVEMAFTVSKILENYMDAIVKLLLCWIRKDAIIHVPKETYLFKNLSPKPQERRLQS